MKFSITNTHILISEIEKRPAIWDVTIPDYSDKLTRKRCWMELSEIFSAPEATDAERFAMCELLQKKWKHIRDRFSRETKTGKEMGYKYGEKLKFLKKLLKPSKNSTVGDIQEGCDPSDKSSRSASMDDLDASEDEWKPALQLRPRVDISLITSAARKPSGSTVYLDESEEEPLQKRPRIDNSLAAHLVKYRPSSPTDGLDDESRQSQRSKTDNFIETRLLELLERNQGERQEKTKHIQDEDRMFLMSLLTSMKSIPPHFKLKAKIEIMSVIDKYSKIYEVVDTVNQPHDTEEYAILP